MPVTLPRNGHRSLGIKNLIHFSSRNTSHNNIHERDQQLSKNNTRSTMYRCCRWKYCLFVLICVVFWIETTKKASAEENGADPNEDKYLYHTKEAEGIIIDYEPPPVSTKNTATDTDRDDLNSADRPDFLYGLNQGPRVVEYYAPWCPHCQHFRSHYIAFAQQVNTIMKEYGVSGPPIQFYAVSCTVNKKLCRAQDITGYPKIKLYTANAQGNATKMVSYWKLHVFDVLDALNIHVKHLPVVDSSAFDTTTITDTAAAYKLKDKQIRTKQQVFDDAYLSFDFNMRNGIFVHDGPLSNQAQLALKSWLTLVKKSIPVVWQLHAVVNDLLKDFQQITTSEEHLLRVLDQHPPATKTWSTSCTKGVDGMGYTCGLWQLLHIISVGLVEYNLMITANDDSVLSTLSIRTTDGAETIRNFVEHFFACDVCRYNFLKDYDNCAHDRCHRLSSTELNTEQWIQFPIWMFETHNAVNLRLQEERKVDTNINVEWPSRDACSVCWLDHGGWDDEAVYKYLRTEYWSEDLISADYRAEVSKRVNTESILNSVNSQLIIQLVEWSIVIVLIGLWYKSRAKRIRSGLHKKRDLDC